MSFLLCTYAEDHQLLVPQTHLPGALPLDPTGEVPSPRLPMCEVQKILKLNYGAHSLHHLHKTEIASLEIGVLITEY